jgi:hypothetical protein
MKRVIKASETSRNGINNRWELLSHVLDIPNIKYKFNVYGRYEDDDFSITKDEHWCGWWNECFCFVNIWPKSDYSKKKLLEVKDVFSEHGYTFTKLVSGGLGINFKTMTEEESNKKAESNLLRGGRMSD